MTLHIHKLGEYNISTQNDHVFILPIDFLENKTDNHQYSSETLSFYKYVKNEVPIKYFTEPELLVTNQSGEWLSPVILVTSEFISQNPTIASIICGLISNYIYDLFKPEKMPNVNVKVIYEETETSKLTEIHYQGSVEGITELKDAISKIAEKS